MIDDNWAALVSCRARRGRWRHQNNLLDLAWVSLFIKINLDSEVDQTCRDRVLQDLRVARAKARLINSTRGQLCCAAWREVRPVCSASDGRLPSPIF
nr:hypothetical protein CFP56_52148 [Quercus suber]